MPPAISVSPSTFPLFSSVTVSWSGMTPLTAGDWITIQAPGAGPAGYQDWFYAGTGTQAGGATPGATGSWSHTFVGIQAAGTYDVTYNANASNTVLATTSVVVTNFTTVKVPSYCLPSATITVYWDNVPAVSNTDWMPLYAGSSTLSAYTDWKYIGSGTQSIGATPPTSGSISYTMPATLGAYYLNYDYNGQYLPFGSSNTINVVSTLPPNPPPTFNNSMRNAVQRAAMWCKANPPEYVRRRSGILVPDYKGFNVG